jgi:hypothetical protein
MKEGLLCRMRRVMGDCGRMGSLVVGPDWWIQCGVLIVC